MLQKSTLLMLCLLLPMAGKAQFAFPGYPAGNGFPWGPPASARNPFVMLPLSNYSAGLPGQPFNPFGQPYAGFPSGLARGPEAPPPAPATRPTLYGMQAPPRTRYISEIPKGIASAAPSPARPPRWAPLDGQQPQIRQPSGNIWSIPRENGSGQAAASAPLRWLNP